MSENNMPKENLRTFQVEKFVYEGRSIPAEIIYDPVRAKEKQTESAKLAPKQNAENKKANIRNWLILILCCTLVVIMTWAIMKAVITPSDDGRLTVVLVVTYIVEFVIIVPIVCETNMVNKKTDLKAWDYYSANERFSACWRDTNVQVAEGNLKEYWGDWKLGIVAADASGVVQEFTIDVSDVPVVKMIDFAKIRIDLAENKIAIPFHMPSTKPPKLPT